MPELAEAVETPEVDTATPPSDGSAETEIESPSPDTETTAAEVSETVEQPETETPDAQDGRVLPAALKKHLAELKASNPALSKELRDLWFANRALKEEFPGGLQEVRQLRESIQEFGGMDGIRELQTSHADYEDVDRAWMEGDPQLVDRLQTASPESFNALMPRFIDKFSQVDPEGYQAVFGRILAATLRDSDIGNALYLAKQNLAIKNTDEAARLLGEVEQWIGSINELAKKAPASAGRQPNSNLDQREQQIAEREAQVYREGVARDFRSSTQTLMQGEIRRIAKGAIGETRMGKLMAQADIELGKLVDKDASIRNTLARFEANRDHEGALRFIKSKVAPLIPKAIAAVYNDPDYRGWFNVNAPKPAAAAKPKPAMEKVAQGWVKIQAPPRAEEVDHQKTTFDMKFHNRAILKNGKQVVWG